LKFSNLLLQDPSIYEKLVVVFKFLYTKETKIAHERVLI